MMHKETTAGPTSTSTLQKGASQPGDTPSANTTSRSRLASSSFRVERLASSNGAASDSFPRKKEFGVGKSKLTDADHQLEQYLSSAPRRSNVRSIRTESGSLPKRASEGRQQSGKSNQRLSEVATPQRVSRPTGLLSDARRPLRFEASQSITGELDYSRADKEVTKLPSNSDKGKRKLAEHSGQGAGPPMAKKGRGAMSSSRNEALDGAGTSKEISKVSENQVNHHIPVPVIGASSSTSGRSFRPSASVRWVEKRPSGKRGNQWDNRKAFDRAWNEQQLHTEMPPEELADRVLQLRLHGVPSTSGTTIAARIVKAKGVADYENRYYARMQSLTGRYSLEMSRIKNDDVLSKIDSQKQMEIAVDETLRRVRHFAALKKRYDNDIRPIAQRPEAKTNIERVGKTLRDHLKSKNIDFHKAPLEQIEREARELDRGGMVARHFSRALYRYIKYYRGDRESDLIAVKRARRNTVKLVNQKAKKRARKQQG